jgi:nicotinate-nucleotide adenylyltransferase
MQCIGILGGTFNPIHYGHLRIAQEAAEAFALSQVKFLPAAKPPLKKEPIVSAKQRAEMVQLAIAANPLFSLDSRELDRNGPSYTIDTLESLRADHPEEPLCLIIGTDAFAHFDQWHRWQQILDYCHLIVVSRPPVANLDLSEPLHTLLQTHQTDDTTKLSQHAHGLIAILTVTALDISSSHIRSIVHAHQNPAYLCPEVVISYIQAHQLYIESL